VNALLDNLPDNITDLWMAYSW